MVERPYIAFCVALVLLVVAKADAQEQRCIDLGSNCLGSEQLDTTTFTQPGGSTFLNPTDSNTTKELGIGGNGAFIAGSQSATAYVSFVPEADMPAGNTVSHVMRVESYTDNKADGLAIPFGTKRFCQRLYVEFSNDYTPWATCNNKLNEVKFNSNGQIQGSTASGDRFLVQATQGGFTGISTTTNYRNEGDRLTTSDCKDTWCRYETCISGDDVRLGTNLSLDIYVDAMDGASGSNTGNSIGNAVDSFSYTWPLNLYREDTVGSCAGHANYSHVMQAAWTSDEGQTIGAAQEIEGTGSPVVTLAPSQTSVAEGGSVTWSATIANGTPISPTADFDLDNDGFDCDGPDQCGVTFSGNVATTSSVTYPTATGSPFTVNVRVNDTGGDYDNVQDSADLTVFVEEMTGLVATPASPKTTETFAFSGASVSGCTPDPNGYRLECGDDGEFPQFDDAGPGSLASLSCDAIATPGTYKVGAQANGGNCVGQPQQVLDLEVMAPSSPEIILPASPGTPQLVPSFRR